MKSLIVAFKSFTMLKQAGLLILLLLSLWATFKGIIYVNEKEAVKQYVNEAKETWNTFLNEDIKNVKIISEDVSSSTDEQSNFELCSGSCTDIAGSETTMPTGVETDNIGTERQTLSPEDESYFERWYKLIEQESESVSEEMQLDCAFNQTLDCVSDPQCCILE